MNTTFCLIGRYVVKTKKRNNSSYSAHPETLQKPIIYMIEEYFRGKDGRQLILMRSIIDNSILHVGLTDLSTYYELKPEDYVPEITVIR